MFNLTPGFKRVATFLFLAVNLANSPAFAASSSFSAGVNSFKNHDFGNAEKELKVALSGTGAKNAQAHYYLASTLLQMHRYCEERDPPL